MSSALVISSLPSLFNLSHPSPVPTPADGAIDDATAQLIAQLLANDVAEIEASAERDHAKDSEDTQAQSDRLMALRHVARDAQVAADAVTANKVRQSISASVQDGMVAKRVAAVEVKLEIDHQYAVRLQTTLDQNEIETNADRDAETLLGQEAIDEIMANHPNAQRRFAPEDLIEGPKPDLKGKGKQPAQSGSAVPAADNVEAGGSEDELEDLVEHPIPLPGHATLECGICFDNFHPTSNPFMSSNSAASSNQVPYGLRLSKCGHGYCLADLTTYLKNKLNGGGEGLTVVFPIGCPSCGNGVDAFDDDAALRVLGPAEMVAWIRAREIDAHAKCYCPRAKCSALVLKPDDASVARATCPSCKEDLCVRCESVWHPAMSCDAFQALPADERSLEDGLLFALAKSNNWRRCPKCKAFVERIEGCRHITCKCRSDFCYACGGDWDMPNYRCRAGCDLISIPPEVEDPVAAPVLQQVHVAGNARHGRIENVREWYATYGRLGGGGHATTRWSVQKRTCTYCMRHFGDLDALVDHYNRPPHPVYFCCGKLFRDRKTLRQHRTSPGHQ